ncbi:hypothetical protein [Streptomyces botrytidirepellens]|uniref:Uncharacterized protein n=1 Tax=Streptomyces botrytidirepellens TaxID=2486417 RepID=A0A3M8WM68_9ACTN|nr:hypothetical protein [Streptomyces botrytidirepellens]RNG30370.1 hypothetical protein EEJ42_10820 [Streptomyces botrytidirepellens]
MTAATTPETRAASLFVTAFNLAYEHDPLMKIAVHFGSGSSQTITGQLDAWRMRFHPAEVSTLLAWLTRAVATDPESIITVTTTRDADGTSACGWAWCLATGAALDFKNAAPYFDDDVELRGAEYRNITLDGPLADTSPDGLSRMALTDEVKTIVTAHGEPPQPATGHRIVLRADGTITVHITAADVPAARKALEKIELEDFDVEHCTRHGHLIGHITLGEADSAELVSIDGIPADELSAENTD